MSLGIVVNSEAQRFYDEGEDFWPKRYAIWGRLVAGQPDQIAYSIIDAKSMGKFMPPVYPPVKARSIARAGARRSASTRRRSKQTVARIQRRRAPRHFRSHDARRLPHRGPRRRRRPTGRAPIDTPPFYAYPLRPGITFTYLGVAVDDEARAWCSRTASPCDNIFAAGEIMAGNVLGKGYLAGIGMTIGTTFGRIAGEEAARHVRG